MFQQVGEHASDALAAHVAVGTEPLRHPVDRAHEEEHRHARIGLADAAVLYTLGDQLAELLLKIVTALRDHGAVFGFQRGKFAEHRAGADLTSDQFDITATDQHDLFAPGDRKSTRLNSSH